MRPASSPFVPHAAGPAAMLLLLALAGCIAPVPTGNAPAPRPGGGPSSLPGQNSPAPTRSTVAGTNNQFTVDDPKGRRLLESHVKHLDGLLGNRSALQGPIELHDSHSRLFQKGKFQMTLDSPHSTWDGSRLISDTPVHGVTADEKTIIDARKATWVSDSGLLILETARMQSMKGGVVEFTAEGPYAEVLNDVVTMNRGGSGRNKEGQSMRGDRVRWNLKTNILDAEGHVVVDDPGTRVTGQRLHSDTKLQRGRVWGQTRTVMQRSGPGRKGVAAGRRAVRPGRRAARDR